MVHKSIDTSTIQVSVLILPKFGLPSNNENSCIFASNIISFPLSIASLTIQDCGMVRAIRPLYHKDRFGIGVLDTNHFSKYRSIICAYGRCSYIRCHHCFVVSVIIFHHRVNSCMILFFCVVITCLCSGCMGASCLISIVVIWSLDIKQGMIQR